MIELAVAVAVGGAAFLAVRFQLKARRAWSRFAKDYELTLDWAKGAIPRMRGQRRGFEFVLHGFGEKDVSVQILDVDPWFTLGPGDASGSRHAVGDPRFDKNVLVQGDRDFVLGLLDHEVRRLAEKTVFSEDCKVERGSIHAVVEDVSNVPHRIDRLLRLAEHLRRPSSNDLPPRLARNALRDPAQGFRLLAFRQLVRSFQHSDEILPAAKGVLRSSRGELRLEAARCLMGSSDPRERQEASDALAEIAADGKPEPWVRRAALELLIRSDCHDLVLQIAKRLLLQHDERSEIRSAAISVCVEVGAVEVLLGLQLPQNPTWAMAEHEAESLARALGRLGDPRAQPWLLELLRHPLDRVGIAAAQVLGGLGDVSSVKSLREAVARRSAVSRAAEAAIEQIQRRLGGLHGGELSVVSTEPLEGAVSPADDSPDDPKGGEVSLAE